MKNSIRKRLVIILLSIITMTGSVTLFFSYRDARREVQELFDAQLAQSSRVLHAIILNKLKSSKLSELQNVIEKISVLGGAYTHDTIDKNGEKLFYERKLAFQIWEPPDTLLLHSAYSPGEALSKNALSKLNEGYSDEIVFGRHWRVFSYLDKDNNYFMQVGERYDVRGELIDNISRQLIRPSLVSIPLLGILIWFAIGSGLMPLKRVTHEVSRRNQDNLEAITIQNVPIEIQPLTEELNKLLLRLEVAMMKEREFTDDAAHELRTPLAALKVQAQVAIAANSGKERRHALKQIITGVDRATHLVNQLLVLIRTEHQFNMYENVNLRDFVSNLIQQFNEKLTKKNISVDFKSIKNVVVTTELSGLSILLNNLIDNAINYSPVHSVITIKTEQKDFFIILSIIDQGEGIPESDLKRVFDRFYRVTGNSVPGCGLGLTISKQMAKKLNIKFEIKNLKHKKGLEIKLLWHCCPVNALSLREGLGEGI